MQVDIYTVADPKVGKLSIMARPRGGDWLEDEIKALRQAGVEVVVSLLTKEEVVELELQQEANFCQLYDIVFLSLPVPDRQTPPFSQATFDFLDNLANLLNQGNHIAIHCRIGIGRSALIAASLMVKAGFEAESAFEALIKVRGKELPDTPEQKSWVAKYSVEYCHSRPI